MSSTSKINNTSQITETFSPFAISKQQLFSKWMYEALNEQDSFQKITLLFRLHRFVLHASIPPDASKSLLTRIHTECQQELFKINPGLRIRPLIKHLENGSDDAVINSLFQTLSSEEKQELFRLRGFRPAALGLLRHTPFLTFDPDRPAILATLKEMLESRAPAAINTIAMERFAEIIARNQTSPLAPQPSSSSEAPDERINFLEALSQTEAGLLLRMIGNLRPEDWAACSRVSPSWNALTIDAAKTDQLSKMNAFLKHIISTLRSLQASNAIFKNAPELEAAIATLEQQKQELQLIKQVPHLSALKDFNLTLAYKLIPIFLKLEIDLGRVEMNKILTALWPSLSPENYQKTLQQIECIPKYNPYREAVHQEPHHPEFFELILLASFINRFQPAPFPNLGTSVSGQAKMNYLFAMRLLSIDPARSLDFADQISSESLQEWISLSRAQASLNRNDVYGAIQELKTPCISTWAPIILKILDFLETAQDIEMFAWILDQQYFKQNAHVGGTFNPDLSYQWLSVQLANRGESDRALNYVRKIKSPDRAESTLLEVMKTHIRPGVTLGELISIINDTPRTSSPLTLLNKLFTTCAISSPLENTKALISLWTEHHFGRKPPLTLSSRFAFIEFIEALSKRDGSEQLIDVILQIPNTPLYDFTRGNVQPPLYSPKSEFLVKFATECAQRGDISSAKRLIEAMKEFSCSREYYPFEMGELIRRLKENLILAQCALVDALASKGKAPEHSALLDEAMSLVHSDLNVENASVRNSVVAIIDALLENRYQQNKEKANKFLKKIHHTLLSDAFKRYHHHHFQHLKHLAQDYAREGSYQTGIKMLSSIPNLEQFKEILEGMIEAVRWDLLSSAELDAVIRLFCAIKEPATPGQSFYSTYRDRSQPVHHSAHLPIAHQLIKSGHLERALELIKAFKPTQGNLASNIMVGYLTLEANIALAYVQKRNNLYQALLIAAPLHSSKLLNELAQHALTTSSPTFVARLFLDHAQSLGHTPKTNNETSFYFKGSSLWNKGFTLIAHELEKQGEWALLREVAMQLDVENPKRALFLLEAAEESLIEANPQYSLSPRRLRGMPKKFGKR